MRVFVYVFILLIFGELQAEVYDCFAFFNELELLRLRLEELSDVVDHFVLVESPISFSGKKKPLYYQENKHLFNRFHDKITHIVIDNFPNLTGDLEKDHWSREAYTRNEMMNGLKHCQDDDVIFISDLDEIPRADAVHRIKLYLMQFNGRSAKSIKGDDTRFVCGLDMRLFMYSMNRENLAGWYGGSKATPYWMVRRYTPWGIKLFHHKYSMHKISNAGWHFNTMGGKNLSLYKWIYTGPTYYPGAEEALLELGRRPELLEQSYNGQVESNTIIVPIDDSFPRYFLEHLNHFRERGWISES
jgi:beta-1,4-mannosyl-glycoprotein beta-1,4-N-acetylglucosaminyltransferase